MSSRLTPVLIVSLCCSPLLLDPGIARAQQGAVIVSPRRGAEVERFEEMEGRLTGDGWPVVLVKPPGDEPWYVQPRVEGVKDGKFTSKVYFGDGETRSGTRFRIIILVVKNQAAAARFEAGDTLKTLPASLPKSEPVVVTKE
jgi:hypothetical protein